MTQTSTVIPCEDLDAEITRYQSELGFRLDMIVPADSPMAAVMSREDEEIRLERSGSTKGGSTTPDTWIRGRAGMMYRDLIPGRLGGRLIASNIRLTVGGEVPDYVHYHKVRFQMIYCLRGAIKVVYEDQGEPFWLHPGDCVLQPPEIRHRVLWAEEGSEVVELGIPAVHETWVEHEITLPTAEVRPDRDFRGQRFVRHIAAGNDTQGVRDTGISAATNGLADVQVVKFESGLFSPSELFTNRESVFGFVISGKVRKRSSDPSSSSISAGDAFVEEGPSQATYEVESGLEVLFAAF
ncbi:MAG TPA: cupin domain-containing protein [Pyrinomonadaceae bacterium]